MAQLDDTLAQMEYEQAGSESVITISQLSQPYNLDVYLEEADWSMAQAA